MYICIQTAQSPLNPGC
uniref:Uncharacterized protein n=1 Tax=Arundo donax TaxID=35708 RepID=A0A0A8ZMA5_ARUDO